MRVLSGFGLGPRAISQDLKLTNLEPRPAASEVAKEETENNDRSVVTDSWEGDRNIRQLTAGGGAGLVPVPLIT